VRGSSAFSSKCGQCHVDSRGMMLSTDLSTYWARYGFSALKVSVERHFDVFEHQIITYVVFVHICAFSNRV